MDESFFDGILDPIDPETDLEVVKQIGEGGYSIVNLYRFKDRPDKLIIGKKYKQLSSDTCFYFWNEIAFILSLDHPNIIKCVGYYISKDSEEDEGKKNYFIFLEYISCKYNDTEISDLNSFIQYINPNNIHPRSSNLENTDLEITFEEKDFNSPKSFYFRLFFFYKLVKIVQFLHENDIVHCDLKPHNVLVRSNPSSEIIEPVLTDFGTTKFYHPLQNSQYSLSLSTDKYAAKELVCGKNFTEKADIYSLGVIGYEIMNLRIRSPNDNNNYVGPLSMDKNKSNLFQYIQNLLEEMQEYDHMERPSIQYVIQLLESELNEIDFYKKEILIYNNITSRVKEEVFSKNKLNYYEYDFIQNIKVNPDRLILKSNEFNMQRIKLIADDHFYDINKSQRSRAQCEYAFLLDRGIGLKRDSGSALLYFEASAELENPYAMLNLGHIYEKKAKKATNSIEKEKYIEKAEKFYKNSAVDLSNEMMMSGYAAGQNCYGLFLYDMKPEQRELALDYFKASADNNDSDGQNNLGILIEDKNKQIDLFKESFIKCNSCGQLNYYSVNPNRMKEPYYAHPNVQLHSRAVYVHFPGHTKFYYRMRKQTIHKGWELYNYFKESARSILTSQAPKPLFYAGICLYYGIGVSRDRPASLACFKECEKDNNHAASFFLGEYYRYKAKNMTISLKDFAPLQGRQYHINSFRITKDNSIKVADIMLENELDSKIDINDGSYIREILPNSNTYFIINIFTDQTKKEQEQEIRYSVPIDRICSYNYTEHVLKDFIGNDKQYKFQFNINTCVFSPLPRIDLGDKYNISRLLYCLLLSILSLHAQRRVYSKMKYVFAISSNPKKEFSFELPEGEIQSPSLFYYKEVQNIKAQINETYKGDCIFWPKKLDSFLKQILTPMNEDIYMLINDSVQILYADPYVYDQSVANSKEQQSMYKETLYEFIQFSKVTLKTITRAPIFSNVQQILYDYYIKSSANALQRAVSTSQHVPVASYLFSSKIKFNKHLYNVSLEAYRLMKVQENNANNFANRMVWRSISQYQADAELLIFKAFYEKKFDLKTPDFYVLNNIEQILKTKTYKKCVNLVNEEEKKLNDCVKMLGGILNDMNYYYNKYKEKFDPHQRHDSFEILCDAKEFGSSLFDKLHKVSIDSEQSTFEFFDFMVMIQKSKIIIDSIIIEKDFKRVSKSYIPEDTITRLSYIEFKQYFKYIYRDTLKKKFVFKKLQEICETLIQVSDGDRNQLEKINVMILETNETLLGAARHCKRILKLFGGYENVTLQIYNLAISKYNLIDLSFLPWLENPVLYNFHMAQYLLGTLYFEGVIVNRDYKKAIKHFRRAYFLFDKGGDVFDKFNDMNVLVNKIKYYFLNKKFINDRMKSMDRTDTNNELNNNNSYGNQTLVTSSSMVSCNHFLNYIDYQEIDPSDNFCGLLTYIYNESGQKYNRTELSLTASSLDNIKNRTADITNIFVPMDYIFGTYPTPKPIGDKYHAFIIITFKRATLIPTGFAIDSRPHEPFQDCLTKFKIQARLHQNQWEDIYTSNENDEIVIKTSILVIKLEPKTAYYNEFKIEMLPGSADKYSFHLNRLEIFGKVSNNVKKSGNLEFSMTSHQAPAEK